MLQFIIYFGLIINQLIIYLHLENAIHKIIRNKLNNSQISINFYQIVFILNSIMTDIYPLLLSKGDSIQKQQFINLIKMEFSQIDDIDLNAVIDSHIPLKENLNRKQYLNSYQTLKHQIEKISNKDKQNTCFLFNSALQVSGNKVQIRQIPNIFEIDTNADFKDILGEQFYRKLINYGSNGLLFQKLQQKPCKSYSLFQWIQNKIEIPINQEGQNIYLILLKKIWMFKFQQAILLLQKIKITSPEDSEISTIQLGLSSFVEIYLNISDNEELKEVFIDRKEFSIRYQVNHSNKGEVNQFNQKITQIKQQLIFNANYFQFLKKDLKNKYYFAIACFLSNKDDNFIKENDPIITSEEISITDRFFYAKRFYRPEDFQNFKNGLMDNYMNFWRLEYILLFGTRKQSEIILQNYLDQTSELQKAAFVSVYLTLFLQQSRLGLRETKIAFYNKFITAYQQLLTGMDLGISNHKFYQKRVTIQVQRKKKTMNKTFSFSCQNCRAGQCLLSITKRISNDLKQHQLRMKGNNYFSKDQRNQIRHCLDCMFLLPKCAVCLFPVTVFNGYAEQLKKNHSGGNKLKNCGESLSNSLVWCPKCFHGGHFAHVIKWMQRTQKKCPVYSCKCKCSL